MASDSPASTNYVDVENGGAQCPSTLLCQKCRAWDDISKFSGQAWNDGTKFGRPSENRSSLEELSYNMGCLICRAVVTVVDTRRGESESLQSWPASRISVHNDGPFFLDEGTRSPNYSHRFDSSDPTEMVVRLLMSLDVRVSSDDSASPARPDYIDNTRREFRMTPQFCLRYSKIGTPNLISIEPWEFPYFDVSLLKTWMQGCERDHGNQYVVNRHCQITDLPSGFRVINVRSMNIVKPVDQLRFVALSYMWQQGGDDGHIQLERENLKELEVSSGIANVALPKIITDAISLCKDLGETYLWVDRLCIIQDDPDSKHSQICGMDKIYRSATVTIIAALNDRDGRGLPGSCGCPRTSSIWNARDLKIEERGIRSHPIETIVNPSLWNMWGWIFRERVLSRRCLYITEHQVIFECSRGHASEELTYYSPRPYELHDSEALSDPTAEEERQVEGWRHCQITPRPIIDGYEDYWLKDTETVMHYCCWVENYTSRRLSFGSDILNAFAGVGNYLGEALGSRMIFGLPDQYIPQALMWSCFGLAEQRTGMSQVPSWSWASSLNRADYSWILGRSGRTWGSVLVKDLEKTASLVHFYLHDPDLGLRKLDIEERWIDHEVNIEDFRNMDGVPELTGKYIPGIWRSNNTWLNCPHNPWQTLAHLDLDPGACSVAATIPGSLVFNTTVASLRLGHKLSVDTELEDIEFTERDIEICDSKGRLVGWMNKMSLDWIDKHRESRLARWLRRMSLTNRDNKKNYEFIVICGALAEFKSRKVLAQHLINFDTWRLHVMLIERLPSKPYIARRVDVGYIFAHKWKDCNPRWETIVLC